MSLDSAFPAMVGGFATTVIAEYAGFKNPILDVLGAGLGSSLITKLQKFYYDNKETMPLADKIGNLTDKLQGMGFVKQINLFVFVRISYY